MADDIRTRLSEALDEAEELAKAAIESVEHSTGNWDRPRDHASGPYMVEDHFGCGAIVYHEGRPTADQALHIARWDPSTVLRLVERDRQLLADVVMVEEQQREHSAKLTEAWRPDGDQASIPRLQEHAERIGGRLDALMAEVERAVALWLGEGAP